MLVQIDDAETPYAVVIGEDVTKSYIEELPTGTAVSKSERVVRLPLYMIIEAVTTLSLVDSNPSRENSDAGHTDNSQS